MAQSPSHTFGQIIGDLLEAAVEPLLKEFAQTHGLYLDKAGNRPARSGKKVSWIDSFENKHDLDFVLEKGGTDHKIGTPVAFIETAWRRYTKHSRNKAQEIQGAILPLAMTHRHSAPFLGVILAGVFTEGALAQLKSRDFSILFFPYESVIGAFAKVGIDADFDEDTPISDFAQKVSSWKALSSDKKLAASRELITLNESSVKDFIWDLQQSITRIIESVRIIPLHGDTVVRYSISEALTFVATYDENNGNSPLVKYEIQIRYNNEDKIDAEFSSKHAAIDFLKSYQSARPAGT